MKEDIVLPSTQKGFISFYVWSIIWFVGLWFFASWVSGFRETLGRFDFPWPQVCMGISYGIMAIIAFCFFYGIFYSTREIKTLSFGDDGFLHKISRRYYDFPFAKHEDQEVFDRILEIKVHQPSISRSLDVGDLTIKTVTFVNAESHRDSHFISGIVDPWGKKQEIEKATLPHEGLALKVSQAS